MRLPFVRAKGATSEPAPPPRPPRAPGPAPTADEAQVAAARTQARRRLVGAVVLLAVGVIGFPLLFETQPRPLPQDTPIVLSAQAQAARASASAAPPLASLPAVPSDAGVEPVASVPASAPASASSASAGAAGGPPAPAGAATRPAQTTATPVPAGGRWVVQVGAYNDMERLRTARAKLQRLGYASFTQEVDSPTGKRTRVRVGPFKSRAEADAVAARVKTAGLQAAVLAL